MINSGDDDGGANGGGGGATGASDDDGGDDIARVRPSRCHPQHPALFRLLFSHPRLASRRAH